MVGVSGGIDSLTLLHVLVGLCDELDIKLHVATLDHGLRGSAGAADADFVRQTAEQWGIPATVGSADVLALAREQGGGIEDAARQARYDFFDRVCMAIGTRQIAVAHQRDDQIETVLMHLARGAGASGLRGMLPVTERAGLRVIRPFLNVPRAIIETYAATHGLITRLDATNADPTYTRNRIRLETLPILRTLNPAIDEALAHTAELARAEYDALGWTLRTHLANWPHYVERTSFTALPLGLQRFAVHQIAPDWSFDQVEALVDWLIRGKTGEWRVLPDGKLIQLTFAQIVIGPADDETAIAWPALPLQFEDDQIEVSLPGRIELANGWHLSVAPLATHDIPSWDRAPWNDPLHTVLIVPPLAKLSVRRYRAGDRFAPHGLGGHTQKLSDTLINLKIPATWRIRLPLLTINGEIAWFVAPTPDGLRARVSERFAWRIQATERWHFCYERTKRSLPGHESL